MDVVMVDSLDVALENILPVINPGSVTSEHIYQCPSWQFQMVSGCGVGQVREWVVPPWVWTRSPTAFLSNNLSCPLLSRGELSMGLERGKLFYWRASTEGLPGMWAGFPAGPHGGRPRVLLLCTTGCAHHQCGGEAPVLYLIHSRAMLTGRGVEGCKGTFRGRAHAAFLGGALSSPKWLNMCQHVNFFFYHSMICKCKSCVWSSTLMLFERKILWVCMSANLSVESVPFCCQHLPSGAATDFLKLWQELDIPPPPAQARLFNCLFLTVSAMWHLRIKIYLINSNDNGSPMKS